MYSKTHVFMFGGLLAMVVAVVLPLLFRSAKPAVTPPQNPALNAKFAGSPRQEKPVPSPKSKGWGTSLIPYYSLAVFAYVLYIMYKIAKKKPNKHNKKISSPLENRNSERIGGNQKTKITTYELKQLEEKLSESEKAVEKILAKASKVITEVYQKEMEASDTDTTLSDSCDTDSSSIDSYESSINDEHPKADKFQSLTEISDEIGTESINNDSADTSKEENDVPISGAVVDLPIEEKDVAKKGDASNSKLMLDRAKFLSTTKEVVNAMKEIRSYIEETKS